MEIHVTIINSKKEMEITFETPRTEFMVVKTRAGGVRIKVGEGSE